LQRASTWDNKTNEYGLVQNKIWAKTHNKHSSIHSSTNTVLTGKNSSNTHQSQSFLSRVANKQVTENRAVNQDDNVSPLTPLLCNRKPGKIEELKISLTPNPDTRKEGSFGSQKEALFIAGPGSSSRMVHQGGCQTTSNRVQ
jgi:hypothetical protein